MTDSSLFARRPAHIVRARLVLDRTHVQINRLVVDPKKKKKKGWLCKKVAACHVDGLSV